MKPTAGGLLIAAAVLGSCGGDTGDASATRPEPLVVYAAEGRDSGWSARFGAFTRESGIPVIIRNAGAGAIVDAVIANRGSPPADLLLTPSVVGIVRAADEGGLRPLPGSLSTSLLARVPETLRDPDGYWFAAAVRIAAIAYDDERFDAAEFAGYEALAEPRYRGELCLTSSADPINQTVIAMLIHALGRRPAELAVRGWIANLGQPLFANEAELRAAMDDGRCGLGIVAMSGAEDASAPIAVPRPAYVDADGIGIARHARQPESAAALIEWLLATQPAYPDAATAGDVNVSTAAWQAEEAQQLAARAAYR